MPSELQRTIDGALVLPTTQTGPIVDCTEDEDMTDCDGCGESTDNDDLTEINNEHYCDGCAESWSSCEECNEYVHNDDMRCAGDSIYCESCHDDNFSNCSDCGDSTRNDDLTTDSTHSICEDCMDNWYRCDCCNDLITADDSRSDGDCGTYCESCFNDSYFYCTGCSEPCHNDNAGRYDHCEGCWDDLDCDARAQLIVENDYPGRSRSSSAASVTPVIANRPNSSTCCKSRPFNPAANSSVDCGSYRTFGVELETSSCPGADQLSGRTVFKSSSDGTITGWEFGSTILNGDAGLAEIERFCELAEEHSFAVDSKCGAHAHFGIDDLSDDQRYNVAIAYWMFRDVWTAFVSGARRSNFYCSPIQWRPVVYNGTVSRIEYSKVDEDTKAVENHDTDIRTTSFADFADKLDRYYWANCKAFGEHGTIEIRLHSGTISAKKMKMWVIAHLRFIEFVSNLTREAIVREFHGKSAKTLFSALLELMPADVATHLTERAETFGTTLTTAPEVAQVA